MVNVNELRLGNYLLVNGMMEKVTHIKPNLVVFDDSPYKKKAFRPQDLSPVKLTPEIIQEFGYDDIGEAYRTYGCYVHTETGNNQYILEDWKDDGTYTFCFNRIDQCEVKYLHHFQNIHFCIAGQELKRNPSVIK